MKIMPIKMKRLTTIIGIFVFGFITVASACTLFAATGIDHVVNGGTIMAKNRDEKPMPQILKIVKPVAGYSYYGIFSGKKMSFCAAGINEKGLAVGNSTAGSVSRTERLSKGVYRSKEGLRTGEYMLRYCASVDEALVLPEEFWHEPINFILADKDKIAYVEILPGGEKSITVQTNGVLYHTNHYVNADSLWANEKIGKSSLTRYNRIEELMTEQKIFSLNEFIQFSEDRNAGPNDSIYRVGNNDTSTQTLANFIVFIPKQGSSVLYVKYRQNPEDKGAEKVLYPIMVNNIL
ncbi:MAG: carcinine hydrolase/isopenicillin-N N-acyltransferase family protein [Acidaminococcaceae bacterium]|nr:carcinine hydrolase/isopenicillin-N N-acyltransferase family protein [Acidaminococcaceae bacterium]